jgi:hypothetical protein
LNQLRVQLQLEQRVQQHLVQSLQSLSNVALTPQFTKLDSRFSARPMGLVYTRVDVMVKLDIFCDRNCQRAPAVSGICVTGMEPEVGTSNCIARGGPVCDRPINDGAELQLVTRQGKDACIGSLNENPICSSPFSPNRVDTKYVVKSGADFCEFRTPRVPVFAPGDRFEARRDQEFRLLRRLSDPGPSSRGLLKCHAADVPFYREHNLNYGQQQEEQCNSCLVGRTASVWDLSLERCISALCSAESGDQDRVDCEACRNRGSTMTWDVPSNRCVKYYELAERFAVCRREPGYDVESPRSESRACIACISTPGAWDPVGNRCTVTPEVQAANRAVDSAGRQPKPSSPQRRAR